MPNRIMIIEDTKDIAELIKLHISGINDLEIAVVHDGLKAMQYLDSCPVDLVILDLGLPGMSGYEILQKYREKCNNPVIIVSAKDLDTEKILGLNLGADDYITKPFNPLELVARVNVQLRRVASLSTNSDGIITIGDLQLNTKLCELSKGEEKVELTYTEYKLLKFMMENPNQVYTKQQIYSAIWDGSDEFYFDNTIMVYISKLREKIEDEPKRTRYIKTIRGLGYRFATE